MIADERQYSLINLVHFELQTHIIELYNTDPGIVTCRLGIHVQCCQFINEQFFDVIIRFISYLSYQLHYCALPDKRCLSHGMLPLSGHDDVALFE